MKKHIVGKLNNKKGESLTETLVALLIAVLALTLLASMIVSGNKISAKSREKMSNYYAQNSELAGAAPDDGSAGTISIQNGALPYKLTPGSDSSLSVIFYVNDEFSNTPVISYR